VDFFGDFGLRDTFQKRIAPKLIEIGLDMDKLRMKFSALNVDFDGPSQFSQFKEDCAREHQLTVPP